MPVNVHFGLALVVADACLRFVILLGVGTVVAVDAILTDEQEADLTKRFLAEVAGSQVQICSAL